MIAPQRASMLLRMPASLGPLVAARCYATQTGLGTTSGGSGQPKRKSINVLSDDGRVPWGSLSPAEKIARTTQQSFNLSFIVLGAVLTSGVAYFMYTEVFSPDSKTSHFNRAVNQIKSDPRCIELLGDSKKITAHGEETSNKWRRARPIASEIRKDGSGTEHLRMHFYVEGPKDKGVVNLHMTKRPSQGEFEYKFLALDVQGQSRLYLENADSASNSLGKGVTKMFGVQWTRFWLH